MRKSTWVLIIIVVVVFSFGIWWRTSNLKKKEQAQSPIEKEEITAVEIVKPVPRKISVVLSFTGSIKGENQVQVFSDAPGKLKEYRVHEGDAIKKGQIIALVDRSIPGMEYQPVKVESPISGVVSSAPLDVGSVVSPQVPVAVVVNMDRVYAVFEVGEKDMAKMQKGKRVSVSVDVFPDRTFTGSVTQVSPALNPYSHTVTCKALIPNPGRQLKPGMYARIDAEAESYFYDISVPEQALIEDTENGKYYVFVAAGTKAEKREVEIGLRADGFVGIKSGLKKDEQVVVKGKEYLKDGQNITIVETAKSQEAL